MPKENDELLAFLKASLLETMKDIKSKVEDLAGKVDGIHDTVASYEAERMHIEKKLTDIDSFLHADKVRLDDIEYRKLPEVAASVKRINIIKSSWWKAAAAIVLVSGGIIGIVEFYQGVALKKSEYITRSDLKAMILELKP